MTYAYFFIVPVVTFVIGILVSGSVISTLKLEFAKVHDRLNGIEKAVGLGQSPINMSTGTLSTTDRVQ